ncbi:hypothetical protein D4764_17G0008260 [Takifugu flavidus]|uniref:Uncharacterized protein n=1 Tax=Takifugu flavidus TaxID=433684 RepID=A0A5C6NVJ7_9TELE|nr:hypothetical protein D4764_17G0008260 [Takifugu flavidus]
MKTDLSLSSLQFGLSSPEQSRFTPESCNGFLLRFKTLRWERLDFRAEATESQQEYDFGPGYLEKIMGKKDHTNTKGGWKKKMGSSKKKDWIGLN